ncbi:ATP-dependent DNA helicase [Paenibacillus sp. ACRRX]|uniref:ATP-dependent DNA helicase n=1 Tax=Paenibacillus sp. ACRRX TaxID=2918206 RepID=UPI001EF4BCE5|nr:ATP-dependent DNA helicase [Paenibacillus sp. ACRRX]MCG7408232.1 ATP-dependent DNA helicase [Paenibacillus sp. ACRRX]
MPSLIYIAVRTLVEYVYRSGSIDVGFRTTSTMAEGTKAHQKIQRTYGEQDQKEVHLYTEIACDEYVFGIEGRCDGLLVQDGQLTIDEIKSTAKDIDLITPDAFPVHWAQAKCYAYMYAKEHQVDKMRIQLTYVQVDTEQQKRFVQEVAYGELEQWIMDLLRRYAPYADLLYQHRCSRNKSIERLSFPFDAYRAGQRRLAGAVYRTIEEGVSLYVKAPTGIGKTISTIFPAIKAIGQGLLEHLFYLTAKTITRTAAEDAFVHLRTNGLVVHSVTLTAKEKVCFQAEMSCRKEDCPYADGYYDRLNGGMLDMLSQETLMTRPVIEHYAQKHRLCPFELSLDAAYAADVVIGDYNYIFDPRVSLKRMLAERRNQTALLVDEAHNLVDRAREMFSSTLVKSTFLALQREFKTRSVEIYQSSKAINDYFVRFRKLSEDKYRVEKERPEELVALVETFVLQAERQLASSGGAEPSPLLLDTYFAAQSFVRIGKLFDEKYVAYAEIDRSEVRLRLFCLDPSYLLTQMGKGFRSHIYFSATLSPISYYRDMLGAGEGDYSLSLATPFSADQLKVSVLPVSTRYHDRERTKERVAQLLQQLVENRQGNYLFFFPSYAYMNLVYETFVEEERPDVDVIVQQVDMTEEERERYLTAFQADNGRTLVGFAVMGGIFSEGIDLVGDRLTGVVVVGVGLPQLGLERDILRDYFNGIGKRGYDYAYVYPGMNKVLQAGGRLIRSEQDRGILVLVDDRYLQGHYRSLLPEEWRDYTVLNVRD